jgi:hypothetical protein
MGKRLKFKCTNCDYSTQVSGKPDEGMLVKTNTVLCEKCKEIVDNVTNCLLDEYDIGACPICKSKENIKPWDNIKRPCPKCGGILKDLRGCIMLWD